MKKSKQFVLLYNQLEAYHMLRGRPRSYQDLKSMVRMHLDKETREKHTIPLTSVGVGRRSEETEKG